MRICCYIKDKAEGDISWLCLMLVVESLWFLVLVLVFGFSFGWAEFAPNEKNQLIEAISNEGLQSIKAESTHTISEVIPLFKS